MRLHRFYINQEIGPSQMKSQFDGVKKEVRIDDKELLHQWLKVFRLKASDPSQIKSQFDGASRVVVFNGGEFEYEGYFRMLSKNEAVLVIDKEREVKNPTDIELHIFQSIIKKDNFEFVVEKCTEIGVSAFHPIISERSEKKDLNIERLNKIAKEASEQSGKTKLPEIFKPQQLEKAISSFDGKLFVLDFPPEADQPWAGVSQIFKVANKKVGILIGPEGGWSDNERIWFDEKGIKGISFGQQVLRAETAAIVASTLILLG